MRGKRLSWTGAKERAFSFFYSSSRKTVVQRPASWEVENRSPMKLAPKRSFRLLVTRSAHYVHKVHVLQVALSLLSFFFLLFFQCFCEEGRMKVISLASLFKIMFMYVLDQKENNLNVVLKLISSSPIDVDWNQHVPDSNWRGIQIRITFSRRKHVLLPKIISIDRL